MFQLIKSFFTKQPVQAALELKAINLTELNKLHDPIYKHTQKSPISRVPKGDLIYSLWRISSNNPNITHYCYMINVEVINYDMTITLRIFNDEDWKYSENCAIEALDYLTKDI